MSVRISLRLRAIFNTCCGKSKSGVRFEVTAGEDVLVMSERRTGSMCVMRRLEEPDVIEYKDSDVESDSSLESFEYKAKKHKSRRYK
jgi:hypothetical protein